MKLQFLADGLTIKHDNRDNGDKITFTTGEYQRENVGELYKLCGEGEVFKVTVEVEVPEQELNG